MYNEDIQTTVDRLYNRIVGTVRAQMIAPRDQSAQAVAAFLSDLSDLWEYAMFSQVLPSEILRSVGLVPVAQSSATPERTYAPPPRRRRLSIFHRR